jgi:hypothetical protein
VQKIREDLEEQKEAYRIREQNLQQYLQNQLHQNQQPQQQQQQQQQQPQEEYLQASVQEVGNEI